MTPEEFLACIVAVKKYIDDRKHMPKDFKIGKYWKSLGRMRL